GGRRADASGAIAPGELAFGVARTRTPLAGRPFAAPSRFHAVTPPPDARCRRLQRLAQHPGPAAFRAARLRPPHAPGHHVPVVPGLSAAAVAGHGLAPRQGAQRGGHDGAAQAGAAGVGSSAVHRRFPAGGVMLGYADYALTTALPIEEVRHRIARHLIEWQ